MTVDYLSFLIRNKLVLQCYRRKVKGEGAFGISTHLAISFVLEINIVQIILMKAIQNRNIPQAICMDVLRVVKGKSMILKGITEI